MRPEVKIICNSRNGGVSGGINQIIEYAREVKADFVTAYDQDTQISANLVNVLAADLQKLIESGEPVAAVGPLVIDDFTNNTLPFVHFRFPFNARYRGRSARERRSTGRVPLFDKLRLSDVNESNRRDRRDE